MSAASPPAFAARLSLLLALLLLGFGALMAWVGLRLAAQREAEALQRLSAGLATHIVERWPVAEQAADPDNPASLQRLIAMLSTVNPGIQVYTLDAEGRVRNYLGEPGMVRRDTVALAPIRRFLAGDALPLRGSDPMLPPESPAGRLFSAAMFPPRPGDTRPPGYLYVVLDGPARRAASAHAEDRGQALLAAAWLGGGLLLPLLLGGWLLRRQAAAQQERALWQREQELSAEHREHMAQLAHDLRTPLTALHGQLEALAEPAAAQPALQRALAQSERLRRLTQQLFELARLQATPSLLQRERFALDELVSDTVQKFGARAELAGPPPDRLELVGDWELVERALSNLIDNGLRHAGRVQVSLSREGPQACIRVRDQGPGLPVELFEHLSAEPDAPGRRPPARRSGGLGGLGLAIVQRVASLHGGRLRPEPVEQGTLLSLALPLA